MARPKPPINGEVLFQRRLDLGLTQTQVKELTREAGYEVDNANLSKLERGRIRRPLPGAGKVLGEVYGLTRAQMYAPCSACGQPWSGACMDHPEPGAQAEGRPAA